jgi:hypothetical protein
MFTASDGHVTALPFRIAFVLPLLLEIAVNTLVHCDPELKRFREKNEIFPLFFCANSVFKKSKFFTVLINNFSHVIS